MGTRAIEPNFCRLAAGESEPDARRRQAFDRIAGVDGPPGACDEFLRLTFRGRQSREIFAVLMFDGDGAVSAYRELAEAEAGCAEAVAAHDASGADLGPGHGDRVADEDSGAGVCVYPREVVKACRAGRASSVILAHNAVLDDEANDLVDEIAKALTIVGIRPAGHRVIEGDAVTDAGFGPGVECAA